MSKLLRRSGFEALAKADAQIPITKQAPNRKVRNIAFIWLYALQELGDASGGTPVARSVGVRYTAGIQHHKEREPSRA
jgi:hypothetical protein